MLFPVTGMVEAQTAVGDGQRSGKKPVKLDSAKKGGFSHKPPAPWFQEESWNIPYPTRTAVLVLPNGFQASPRRGSKAVLSISMPTRPFEFFPGIKKVPLAKSKFDWRSWLSVMGVTNAQAIPMFRVRFGVTRQSSVMYGRYNFQRRPVVAPLNV